MSTATAVRSASFDEAKANAFIVKVMGALNGSALMLMTSIGHRTGLFESLAKISPCTALELATEADLAERYVREWLAVMTTSGVVDYEPKRRSYFLPPEHAAFLTRAGTPMNLAVTSQFIGVAASVEDEIVARFRDGKGTHYHHYERFHDVMAEESDQSFVFGLIDTILPLVPGSKASLEQGIDVIDVGCGGGRGLLKLAETYPNSRFTGVDLCDDAFAGAEKTAKEKGLGNLSFKVLDISTIDTLGAYDLVLAFDAVHDQKDPQGMLDTVRRSLRKDGTFLMVDIGGSSRLENNMAHPIAPYLYTISTMHCMPVSLGQDGAGLGTMWGVELASEMLAKAGFGDVTMTRLPHDIVNAYFVARA